MREPIRLEFELGRLLEFESAGYASDEVRLSRTDKGHLPQDVFEEPEGILVADFGVNDSKVKPSTKAELHDHLMSWNANQDYHFRVKGYSDAVGNEKHNQALRNARAFNILGLFGPSARSRVRSWGAAPVGEYHGDNATPESRAKNRSALIMIDRSVSVEPYVSSVWSGKDPLQWAVDGMQPPRVRDTRWEQFLDGMVFIKPFIKPFLSRNPWTAPPKAMLDLWKNLARQLDKEQQRAIKVQARVEYCKSYGSVFGRVVEGFRSDLRSWNHTRLVEVAFQGRGMPNWQKWANAPNAVVTLAGANGQFHAYARLASLLVPPNGSETKFNAFQKALVNKDPDPANRLGLQEFVRRHIFEFGYHKEPQ